MAKKRPPCIRDLKCFREEGCPQQTWDGEDGCMAWMEMTTCSVNEPTKPIINKMCIDMWNFDLTVSILAALEGNQQALESFRNGMLQVDKEGTVFPKPDPGVLQLIQMIHNQIQKQNIIQEHEDKKLIDKI